MTEGQGPVWNYDLLFSTVSADLQLCIICLTLSI